MGGSITQWFAPSCPPVSTGALIEWSVAWMLPGLSIPSFIDLSGLFEVGLLSVHLDLAGVMLICRSPRTQR